MTKASDVNHYICPKCRGKFFGRKYGQRFHKMCPNCSRLEINEQERNRYKKRKKIVAFNARKKDWVERVRSSGGKLSLIIFMD